MEPYPHAKPVLRSIAQHLADAYPFVAAAYCCIAGLSVFSETLRTGIAWQELHASVLALSIAILRRPARSASGSVRFAGAAFVACLSAYLLASDAGFFWASMALAVTLSLRFRLPSFFLSCFALALFFAASVELCFANAEGALAVCGHAFVALFATLLYQAFGKAGVRKKEGGR